MGKKATELTYLLSGVCICSILLSTISPLFYRSMYWIKSFSLANITRFDASLAHFHIDSKYPPYHLLTSIGKELFKRGKLGAILESIDNDFISMYNFTDLNCSLEGLTSSVINFCYSSKLLLYSGIFMMLASMCTIILVTVGAAFTHYFWTGGEEKGRYKWSYIHNSRKYLLFAAFVYLAAFAVYTIVAIHGSTASSGNPLFSYRGIPGFSFCWYIGFFTCIFLFILYNISRHNDGTSKYHDDDEYEDSSDYESSLEGGYDAYETTPIMKDARKAPNYAAAQYGEFPPVIAVNTHGQAVQLPPPF